MKQLDLFIDSRQEIKPWSQYEAIVYFIARLDIEMVNCFLEDEKNYQDLPKYIFVSKLIKALEHFVRAGDTLLALHEGQCDNCSKGCGGFTFLGKKGHYMDILFLVERGVIMDIYECGNFKNTYPISEKKHRVMIEPQDPFGDFAQF